MTTTSNRPNVLIVVADALRADHLSCYGYERETTPNLDRFARENSRYTNAFTPATWTRSAAASILTGTYPSVHGVKTMDDTFNTTLPSIQERFRDAGYQTVAVSAIGNFSSGLGFDTGFDLFVDLYKDTSLPNDRARSSADEEMLEHESGSVVFPRASDVFDRFESEVLETDDDNPFFAVLWTIDPHDPYSPPSDHQPFVDSSYDGNIDGSRQSLRRASTEGDFQRLVNLYDSEISYFDTCLGELRSRLEDAGVYDETITVLVGDHGEAFGDHDGNVGHSNIHYEELIRVPLIVRYPWDKPSWDGDEQLVNLIDIAPTILEYVDVEFSSSLPEQVTGQPFLDGGREHVFGETHYSNAQNSYLSVREQQWKYIRIESPEFSFQPYFELLTNPGFLNQFLRNPLYFLRRRFREESEHLYDLSIDPDERENCIDSADVADRLRDTLDQWQQQVSEASPSGSDQRNVELDEATRQQLKEMGYLE